ncbi:MAG: hypothetical protein RJB38_268 [Pseudomonadota bacterium]|jgi:uncharacterized protein (DUF2062 family)
MSSNPSLLRRKLLQPLLEQLQQGATPEKLAWSVSLGISCGLFPILGSTTFLCAGVGALFRLNHVAMQTVNYLAYAPQLVLIPVFIRAGEWLMQSPPITIDLIAMKELFLKSPPEFFRQFGSAAIHGMVAWVVIMPVPTWLVARGLIPLFKRWAATARFGSSKTSGQESPPSL